VARRRRRVPQHVELGLQWHGDAVEFRNMWIVEKK
jgi:hypothetical protein